MKFLDHDAVVKQRQKKERVEISLVQELGRKFWDDNFLRWEAQSQIFRLIYDMLSYESYEDYKKETSLKSAIRDEESLNLWGKVSKGATVSGLLEVLENFDNPSRGSCSLDDCADVLRLYSKFVKKAKLKSGWYGDGVDAMRKTKDGKDGEELRYAFGKIQDLKTEKDKDKTVKLGGKGEKYRSRAETLIPTKNVIPKHLRKLFDGSADSKNISVESGCNRWALRMQSKSCQIDKAFGLAFGGDISGTTTGSIYALQVAERIATSSAFELDFLVLMPLISLVKLYHHTLLEAALAFMYCNIIPDYNIGYYSTLYPEKVRHIEEYAGILELLRAKEKESPKILIYTREDLLRRGSVKVLRGFLMENQTEENLFKPLASAKNFYKNALEYPSNSAGVVAEHLFNARLADDMLQAIMEYDKKTGRGVNTSDIHNETQYLLKRCKTSSALMTLVHKNIGRRLRNGEIVVF